MGIGKLGGIVAFLAELYEALRFGVQLGISCKAVRMQFLELLRRDAPKPAARIGVASNVLDGAAGRQAVFITMETAPRPNPGLWMRVDVFGREGYRQTFYPFWRDPEVFHDFLASCAEVAEAPPKPRPEDCPADERPGEERTGEDLEIPDDASSRVVSVEPELVPADLAPAPPHQMIDRPSGWQGLMGWLSNLLRPGRPQLGRSRRSGRAARSPGRARRPSDASRGRWSPDERLEPETLAIQTTARRGDPLQSQCSLMCFADLSAVLDHVLLSGNRVAIKVASEGPDLWAVVWRRADGGLYLRWGGLEHPAGPIYRESPRTLFHKLMGYDLDLERVWSQSRPAGV